MPGLTVNIAIIHSGQIVLTQREDFEVWCLPGGGIEAGESAAQAALREAREETGLEVELTRLVGLYSQQSRERGGHSALFAAKPVGGALQPQAGEVIDVCYFAPHELPHPLIWGHHQLILDALDGIGGSVVRSRNLVWPFDPEITRQEIYELRDRSGLSRQQFYLKYVGRSEAEGWKLEVGGK